MNLDEWNALSAGERDELRAHWIPRFSSRGPIPEKMQEWRELVEEAEKRFSARFGDLPEILNIGSSCSFDDQNPPAVFVRTRLPAGEYLQELPDEFLSFPVIQESLGDKIAAFKRTWSAVLSHLFDWPESAIQEWIATHDRVFRNSWFLHDPPLDFIPVQALAQSVVGQLDESDRRKVKQDLVRAIGIRFYVDEEPNYDWMEARRRIAYVLKKYQSG